MRQWTAVFLLETFCQSLVTFEIPAARLDKPFDQERLDPGYL